MGRLELNQPKNWLYEIWQKGDSSPCYVMVPNAQDLVKSHLMIAVREEVEVLKERISELMDRINQLEVENSILKANVSSETLSQLQLQGSIQSAAAAAAAAATQPQLQTTNTATSNATAGTNSAPASTTVPPTVAPTNTTNGPIP